MPRPKKFRFISSKPAFDFFKPSGVPKFSLEEVYLEVDEFEAIRLSDFLGLYQEDAAKKMNVSRQTLGNILVSAHKKIADALINGKALKIEGGKIKINEKGLLKKCECGHTYNLNEYFEECPNCRTPLRGRNRRRRRGRF